MKPFTKKKLDGIIAAHKKWLYSKGGQRAYLQRAYLQRLAADVLAGYLQRSDLQVACTRILPEGDLIGWKKCKDRVIVKVLIPAKAKRSHAFGRKCRAEYVKVLEVIDTKEGISTHDGKTRYAKGKIVKCDKWDDDFTNECSGGIHFFITRLEAENY